VIDWHRHSEAAPRRPTRYRELVLTQLTEVIGQVGPFRRALDFGSGDGWFARELTKSGLVRTVVGVEVLDWQNVVKAPVLFDGARLPFFDRAFDLTYAVDVIHHCREPPETLDEVLRCTARYFLLKDHSYRNFLEWSLLCGLDELGNRRFGVPCLHQYQRRWEWSDRLEARGFTLVRLIHPAACHPGVFGHLTNHLQFVALWRRNDPS